MKIHPSVTQERVLMIAEEAMFGMSDDGICVACGEDQMGVEPDAQAYLCEACDERAVYGAEALLHLI